MKPLTIVALLSALTSAGLAFGSGPTGTCRSYCTIFRRPTFYHQNCRPDIPNTFMEDGAPEKQTPLLANSSLLEYAYTSVATMQNEFFIRYQGTWPRAIDWTAAFIHTSLSAMTDSLSKALAEPQTKDVENSMVLNMVDTYFSQIVGFYFGQDYISLRHQAFDDILWVVLGWLESTNFIRSHSDLHYPRGGNWDSDASHNLRDTLLNQPWHGNHWTEAFAHRERTFWELATKGWGEDLCNGGINWNPRFLTYKNAITNELWIAASAKMYLDFPGDKIASPLSVDDPSAGRNRTFLEAAMRGYEWLMNVNMTNDAGLFVDGFHISNRHKNNTKCDLRDEMVYTYNQGVVLTGQRALWEATGGVAFLNDGHHLIQSVIKATGWDLTSSQPIDETIRGKLPPWRGLGRGGIIEEACDSVARCSQNGQTFKGIYFHHLTYFCRPLTEPLEEVDNQAFDLVAHAHAQACRQYVPWIAHNAEAALSTRDSRGVMGMWWGAEKFGDAPEVWDSEQNDAADPHAVDYRNFGVPNDQVWRAVGVEQEALPGVDLSQRDRRQDGALQADSIRVDAQHRMAGGISKKPTRKDPNTRGRGRTVETQNSGLEVLRAWYELSQAYGDKQVTSGWRFGIQWLFSKLWRARTLGAFSFF
ncbi:hypothetical protein jhhlp_000986 [Lomentospora prolificans]|uniref:Glycosyl hydrolase n=1 Tax=Lomentospora prolificans TaxID=41688 RepID=A0A2N3NK00_9PEZI|nr:hypothetical protein jhhlp_000986 [Lomentospora prolificans]